MRFVVAEYRGLGLVLEMGGDVDVTSRRRTKMRREVEVGDGNRYK